jgi:hypothetical protein
MNNVTPIASAGRPTPAVAIRIERQRVRLFRAMNFVQTTERALEEDFESERDTLAAAWEIITRADGRT